MKALKTKATKALSLIKNYRSSHRPAMTSRNTAFFSTCNNDYLPNSAISLLSIREHCPHAKLFIFSRNISTAHRHFLEQNNIDYFDLDLRGRFYRHWVYPPECFYLFAGPEMLLKNGFTYSVYIDGDILCLKHPLKSIDPITGIGGFAPGDCRGVFLDDFETIKDIFHLDESQTKRPRVTSSVVYFNNNKMQEINLLDTATSYFDDCLKHNIPRKGDDSLFSLIQLTKLNPAEVKQIPYCNQTAFTETPNNIFANNIFFHFAHGKPWDDFKNSSTEDDTFYQTYLTQWRKIFTQYFPPTWGNRYHAQNAKIIQTANTTEQHRLNELSKLHLALPENIRKHNHQKSPLKIFISEDTHLGLTNFGDEVQKDIIPILFGYRVEACSNAADATLFSVGSILFELPNMDLKKPIQIWGSGFISAEPVTNEKLIIPQITVHALRGEKTLKRFQDANHTLQDIPLGDPGILANLIYPANPTKTNQIGIVHHYIDADNPLVEQLRLDKNFLIIDPLEPPRQVALQISSCRFIISSSLHGLIFADSYKIPNAHISFSDKVYGGEYKFQDYDSGVKKTHLEFDPHRLTDQTYIDSIISKYQPIRNLEEIQRALIKSFPEFS